MKIKIVNRTWYNKRLYDPEIEGEKIIEYAGSKCPSWAVRVDGKDTPKKQEEKSEDKTKVNDLPLVEKNALLEAAKAVGIEGNQILSWKVETLKAKIEAETKKQEEKSEDNDNKGEQE